MQIVTYFNIFVQAELLEKSRFAASAIAMS